MEFTTVKYSVSPEDHSRGTGGFNGEWFDRPGITDTDFETLEDAVSAIRKRHPSWVRSDPDNMSGPMFTHPSKPMHLCIFPKY